jgi:hypothetical protein
MRITTIATTAVLGLVLVACGGLNDDGGGAGGGGVISHPAGAGELVLRVESSGGFVPMEYNLTRLPSWSLYGDGRIVTEGPQIEIYPQPALPNLLVRRVTEDGIQAILEAARDAGLMESDATYPNPCVIDAPDTVFTVTADGSTSVVSATALGFEGGGTCEGVDVEARTEIAQFQSDLGDLARWLPEGSVSAEETFTPEEIRIFVLPYQGDPNLPQEPTSWPLETPLASFGKPAGDQLQDASCGTVTGTELETLRPSLEGANQLTPWESGGERHRLLLRPLLPDEHGC